VLKSLVQTELRSSRSAPATFANQSPLSIISKLAYRIDDIQHPHARACVLWLVGQYAATSATTGSAAGVPDGVASWAPDVLRKAAKSFSQEVGR
jgi:AP-3 complex subunit beta